MPAHVIDIRGPDAIAFAHAQFSSPVTTLPVGQWQFSAWLDARGRVQALFHLARRDEQTLTLVLRHGDSERIAAALQRFILRSRVSIHSDSSRELQGGAAQALYSATERPEGLVLGCGDHNLCIGAHGHDAPGWRLQQVRAGWPWLPDSQLGQWLAPALSLQRLHAVVTDKGCYPGQEIVARLHFRGIHKQHLCWIATTHVLHTDEVLRNDAGDVGRILDAITTEHGSEALAILDSAFLENVGNGRPGTFTSIQNLRLLQTWPA